MLTLGPRCQLHRSQQRPRVRWWFHVSCLPDL